MLGQIPLFLVGNTRILKSLREAERKSYDMQ